MLIILFVHNANQPEVLIGISMGLAVGRITDYEVACDTSKFMGLEAARKFKCLASAGEAIRVLCQPRGVSIFGIVLPSGLSLSFKFYGVYNVLLPAKLSKRTGSAGIWEMLN